ncbi:MAG: hypothetical protein ACE5KO_03075 [Candidatus Bathyarchaeia archaeon]
MPKQIRNKEEFVKLSERSKNCLVKRSGEQVKLKLRTPKYLYTFVTSAEVADSLLEKIKCEVIEL